MVGVSGLEPEASWSRTKRATSCAIPRHNAAKRKADCPIIIGMAAVFVNKDFSKWPVRAVLEANGKALDK